MNKFGFDEIKKFVRLVEKSEINELEIVQEGVTLRIRKEAAATMISHNIPQGAVYTSLQQSTEPAADKSAAARKTKEIESSGNLIEIKSPMVGTFYRASSPGADPYIRTGDSIEPGQVLCIVEAMKLMNEIESEVTGKIVRICVENAKPVEYGQVLFEIDPTA